MSEDSTQKRQLGGFRDLRGTQTVTGVPEPQSEMKRLGRYQIVSELGRGAMGMVYEAHDPRIKRVVAIKIITVSGGVPGETEAYRTRFIREAQAAGRLTHPGIVTIYDVDEDPSSRTPFIVMEYVPGKRLDTYVAGLPLQRLPLETALDLGQQIAEALDYAHSQGIVHRDIKPGNVIVTNEGLAKIADFGIAKINTTEMTMPGQILGTPAFMSPEQFLEGTADGRSDLFSLGVVVYWMLTGAKPFGGESATSVSFKLVYKDPTPLKEVAPELDPRFEPILRRALAKDPEERFQSGKEFAQALKGLRHAETPRAAGVSINTAELQLKMRKVAEIAASMLGTIAQKAKSGAVVGLQKARAWELQKHLGRLHRNSRIGLAACFVVVALVCSYRLAGVHKAPTVVTSSAPSSLPQPVAAPPAPTELEPTAPVQTPKRTIARVRPATRTNTNPHAAPVPKPIESADLAPPKLVPAKAPEAPPKLEAPAPEATSVIDINRNRATLLTVGEHQFHAATLAISVDGELAYTGSLKGVRKFPLGGVKGPVSGAISLAPGAHVVQVHVVSQRDNCDITKSIKGEFAADKAKTLSIGFADHNSDMQLAWK